MAPIPGMSLTKEPGNAPWEQPPLYNKPEEALAFYLKRMEDEENLDDLLFLLEQGMPLSALVDSMTSFGVMEGYHSIDVKTLISPVLHEHIKILAETVDIAVVEDTGPTKEQRMKEKDKKRVSFLLSKALDEPETVEELASDVPEAQEMLSEEPEQPLQEPLIKRRA